MSTALARPEIAALQPYVTATQQADTLRLNANEAPDAPLANGLNRYPAIRPGALRSRLATLFEVDEANLLVTRGSSEAIDLLIRTFCRAYQDNIVVTPPTFSMYQVYATMQAAGVVEVPLASNDDFKLDVDEILVRCTDNSKLIFACSPNNPTGGSVPVLDLERLATQRSGQSLVVVDEAYIEFSKSESLLTILNRHDNLVVLRTLSKAWGLAGARCGAVIAHRAVIELLERMLPPYAFSSLTTAGVLESLSDAALESARRRIAITVAERRRMHSALTALACVSRVWPSDSNFLLVRFKDLAAVQKELQQQRILIRAFDGRTELANCARITIGDASDNERLLQALQAVQETRQ